MITSEERVQAETGSVTVERTVNAPPAEVYRAFVTPQALRDWFCNAAQVDPRVGGRIYLAWNGGYHVAGKFTRLAKNELIAYTWHGDQDQSASEVTVEIEGNGGGGSTVRVTHSAPGASQEWLEEAKRDWTEGLESLEAMLERGIDLRLARRPMFGLNGAEIVDDALAEKLGLPVREGIRLTGLVEGMGAQRAGIQPGDVLVRVAGRPMVAFPNLGEALDKYKAGDTVEAELYRDGEKITIPVELTARAMPDLPETAEELAAQARKLYAEVDAELDQLFEGVTEAQADYRPAPDEWNAKEILAHIAASERDVHAWIASLAEDTDIEQPFHSNDSVRVKSMVVVSPTVEAMIRTLKQAEAEVVAAIELLRPESVARKHMFRTLALWITTFQSHHREHFGLIKSMLEAARQ
ncbi:MAG: DinB family protein [Chloroflexia bacterium]